jgi:hypothetical protein
MIFYLLKQNIPSISWLALNSVPLCRVGTSCLSKSFCYHRLPLAPKGYQWIRVYPIIFHAILSDKKLFILKLVWKYSSSCTIEQGYCHILLLWKIVNLPCCNCSHCHSTICIMNSTGKFNIFFLINSDVILVLPEQTFWELFYRRKVCTLRTLYSIR